MKFIKFITIVLEISDSLTLDREKENILTLRESGFILSSIRGRLLINKKI